MSFKETQVGRAFGTFGQKTPMVMVPVICGFIPYIHHCWGCLILGGRDLNDLSIYMTNHTIIRKLYSIIIPIHTHEYNYVYNGIFHGYKLIFPCIPFNIPFERRESIAADSCQSPFPGQLPAFCDHLALLAVWSTRLDVKQKLPAW